MSIDCPSVTGLLSIDGESLNRGAWQGTDYIDLWLGRDLKGTDLDMPPPVVGSRPHPRRFTVTRHSIPFAICGDVDWDGAPNSDHWAGLEENIFYLRENVIDPVESETGTRLAVLTLPSGRVLSGPVHVLGLTPGAKGEGINQFTGEESVIMLATLELSLPYGVLTVGGS